MPEGDTVRRTAWRIDAALAGRVLTRTDFRVPDLATVDLTGHTLTRTDTHGKHLLTVLTSPQGRETTLHTHLKMEGSWRTYRVGSPWTRPEFTARVVLESDDRQAVGFALGVVALLTPAGRADLLAPLGPDLLHDDFDPSEALRRLHADADAPFVQAIQDQHSLAGLGNMYATELAFLTGVHPRTPLGQVAGLDRVVERARQLLQQNVTRSVQSTTGVLRPGRTTWVYRQKACRRCRARVNISKIGRQGMERTTYWCPHCQPAR